MDAVIQLKSCGMHYGQTEWSIYRGKIECHSSVPHSDQLRPIDRWIVDDDGRLTTVRASRM